MTELPILESPDSTENRTILLVGDHASDDHVVVGLEPAPTSDPIAVLRHALANPASFSPIPQPVVDTNAGTMGFGVTAEMDGYRISVMRFVPLGGPPPIWDVSTLVPLVARAIA